MYQLFHDYKHTQLIMTSIPPVRITIQLLNPLMLCVLIIYINGGTYSLKSPLYKRFLKNFFMAIIIYSQNFRQKPAWRELLKVIRCWRCVVWGLNWVLKSLPTRLRPFPWLLCSINSNLKIQDAIHKSSSASFVDNKAKFVFNRTKFTFNRALLAI